MHAREWTLPVSSMIEGRWRVVRRIGVGGMGAVFEAYDTKLERPVAIKCLDPALVANTEHVARFQREALAAGRIGHPNICDVRDRGVTDDGIHFIVMELLEGETFFDLLRREAPLTPRRAVEIVLGVLSALSAAHKAGIVHRDIKPENIFLARREDGQEQVKLLDFGVSRFLDDASNHRLTQTGKVLGTPIYVSPEQALAQKDIDHRSDLWGVGVLLYEALTGRTPFLGKNAGQTLMNIIKEPVVPPRQIVPWISEALERVILLALEKRREDRFQTADSFARALERAMEGSPETSRDGSINPAGGPSRL